MRLRDVILASVLCAPALFAQDVLVVDKNLGAGWEFATIQAAVNAAQDGDIVLVRAGTYYDESLLISGKGITVTAEAGADVRLTEGVRIQFMVASQSTVLRGLRIEPDSWPQNSDKYGLRASYCFGAIWIDDCTLIADKIGVESLAVFEGANVNECVSVVFTDCLVQGGRPNSYRGGQDGGPGLELLRSRVAAFGCQFLGRNAKLFPGSTGIGGDAAFLELSAFYAAGSEFVGGESGTGLDWGRGLFAFKSDVALLEADFAPPGAGGDIVLDQSTLLNLPGERRTLAMSSPVREGETLLLDVGGAPDELVTLLVSLGTHHQFVPAYAAPLLTSLSPALLVPIGSVPLDGSLNLSFPVPLMPPGLEGLALHCQALLTAPGESSLSNATAIILLDGSL